MKRFGKIVGITGLLAVVSVIAFKLGRLSYESEWDFDDDEYEDDEEDEFDTEYFDEELYDED